MFEREMNQKHAFPDTLMNQIYHQLSNLNDVAFKDFYIAALLCFEVCAARMIFG